ncbi:unnamed protein product, partial [marine sediment metagenome]
MALRLHKATHNTEGKEQIAILKDHGWDYGMIGSLMRRDAVGMASLERKQAAAVLQANT